LSEVAPDEHASAFPGLSVVGKQPQAPLALVAEGLEPRHEIAHAGPEAFRRHDNCDAAVLVPFNLPRFLKIRQQRLADPGRYACGIGERLGGRGAFLVRPGSKGAFELLQMPNARAALRLEVLVDFKVSGVEQENAMRRATVASSATNLLNILLQRPWGLVVQYVTDVRLVDPHAKGRRRDHDDAPGGIHEPAMCRVTIGSPHLAVIARHGDMRAPECA